MDKDLDLAGIVNEILPPKKRTKGPSLGEMVFYAALNRAIAPNSKRQLAAWYEATDIQRIRPLRLESLNSQNFWNHWDRINDSDLERKSHGLSGPGRQDPASVRLTMRLSVFCEGQNQSQRPLGRDRKQKPGNRKLSFPPLK
ncbi:MAG: hypothetical protein ABSG90_13530 [Dehalococcoidia bacterium]